jgi:hypothetical protein
MNNPLKNKKSLGRRLLNVITNEWVAYAPEEVACCEFDCQEFRCERGRWESCKHRLHHLAIVEGYAAKCGKSGEFQRPKTERPMAIRV